MDLQQQDLFVVGINTYSQTVSILCLPHRQKCFLCFLPGVILSDVKPLKEYNISDKNFVVVMATKVHSIPIFFNDSPGL